MSACYYVVGYYVGSPHLLVCVIVELSSSIWLEEAGLAPELVSLWTVFSVGVCYHVSTVAAAQDHDSTHLVIRKLVLVTGNVRVGSLHYDVAGLTVVDGVQY
jgi:hypothetical protein